MNNTPEKKFTLGRARDCDIVLADDSVSRRHAELTFLGDGKLLLTDCRSSHGTFLLAKGGQRIRVSQELLSPTDTVQFGGLSMPVKDILEAVRLKFPAFHGGFAPAATPDGRLGQVLQRLPQGTRLVRCACGAVKVEGGRCEVCGQ